MRAIVPGKTAESELVPRITSTDADTVMPPPAFKKPLSPQQIELLQQWIAQGAGYEPHWAFQPVQRPAVPVPAAGPHAGWPRNSIDQFVLARLAQEKLAPAAEASREAWLRRVSFDLTGLPPTPDERAAFLADQSAVAHEKVVDRLLTSPRHAERMALQWLDVARYADTNGGASTRFGSGPARPRHWPSSTPPTARPASSAAAARARRSRPSCS